jgi:23S rRNA-/tRNA-specific pseudouridylate synthase
LETLARNLSAGDVSLTVAAEAAINIGFRHQIRAHMAWCCYPIWGDRLYGGADAPRLCLECLNLELENPQGELEKFELYESEWSDRG